MKEKIAFTPLEKRASYALSLVFAIRMLGLFLLTPVFAEAAKELTGGSSLALVGWALGIYGVTQAIMQIPLGIASDKWGRRPVIIFGFILFIIGGVICALSHSVYGVLIGRAIQGLGAVSAAIVAWIADATRPEVRTRAMAMAGSSIGLAFAASLVLSPMLLEFDNLSGLFWAITILGVICLILTLWVVPLVPKGDQALDHASFKDIIGLTDLQRLDLSVFSLHFCMMALFVVTPGILSLLLGYDDTQLWKFYLPTIVIAVILMIPCVIVIEVKHKHKQGLLASIGLIFLVMLLFPFMRHNVYLFALLFTLFFVVFNVLEAVLPSTVSRVVPPQHKGMALGIFNMSQSLGVACGSAVGGMIAHYYHEVNPVFFVLAAVAFVWLLLVKGFHSVT